ncbi:hypothetical protein [Marinomonas lutimaris]|uniref:hypothetical protein n=1 Tax=Marinomonas lutimaris TaxID=2846746 RepID=UPI001CA4D906|nr:hypothetical protein [Marinomonas lutimaris]
MINEASESRSLIYKVLVIMAFFSFSAGIIFYSMSQMYMLISQIWSHSPVMTYDRGSIFGFGAGLGLLFLTLLMFTKGFLGDSIANRFFPIFKYGLIFSFFCIIFMPFITDHMISNHVNKLGYVNCQSAKVKGTWSIYDTSYYTETSDRCLSFTKEINEERDQAWDDLFN